MTPLNDQIEEAARASTSKKMRDLLDGVESGMFITTRDCERWANKDFTDGATWMKEQCAISYEKQLAEKDAEILALKNRNIQEKEKANTCAQIAFEESDEVERLNARIKELEGKAWMYDQLNK